MFEHWKWWITDDKWLYFRSYLGKRLFTYLILIARIMKVIFLKMEVKIAVVISVTIVLQFR